jgi:hypothetical protein
MQGRFEDGSGQVLLVADQTPQRLQGGCRYNRPHRRFPHPTAVVPVIIA